MSERIQTESGTVILGPYEEVFRSLGGDVRDYTFHATANPAIRTGRTKVFPGRATLGPTDPDVDDTLTTLNFMEVSGGAGVYTIKPASDLNHYWWGVASAEGTDGMTAARETIMRQPASFSGNCVPVGRIGVNAYAFWGTSIRLWDPDAQTFGASIDTVPASIANTEGFAVFNGALFVPLGSTGYSYVSESAGTLGSFTDVTGAATPAYSASPGTSNPRALAFAVWNDMLWCLTTAAEGYAIVPSLTGANNSWQWSLTADEARQTIIKIESTFEPYTMKVFPNAQNQQSLWVAGRRGLKVLNLSEMRWDDTTLTDVPPHPDFGKAMQVFRPGEALHIAGGGGDVIQYTVGGAGVPASGPGGNRDGMPAGKRGSIVSFATDLAHLYALVQGQTASVSAPLTYAAKFGAAGSSNGQFGNDAKQIARDSNGNLYVADFGNDRVQKFTSAGVFDSVFVSSLDEVTGICLDSSNNVYVSYKHGSNDYRVRKYNSAGTLQWTTNTVSVVAVYHVATDGVHVFVCRPNTIARYKVGDGSSATALGSSGSGDGQFSTPYGIAYCAATGNLYVADQGNDRVQVITTGGTFVGKWGASGSSDGQFTLATGIAVSSDGGKVWVGDGTLDRVQLFDGDGEFLADFGSTGTGDGQFDTPDGIVVVSGDASAWVVDSLNDRVQEIDDSGGPYPGLATMSVLAQTGKGWHPAWESSGPVGNPTKIVVADAVKDDGSIDYRAFFGIGEECYSFQCRLTTHSSRQAIQTNTGERFASTGSYLEWGPFHGGSIAIPKLASHAALLMEHATDTDYVSYQYMTDAQSNEAWITLGTATTDAGDGAGQQRTVLPFGLVGDSDEFSEGLSFRWMRQRLLWVGSTAISPAIVTALTLAYLPVPQDAATKAYTVWLPQDLDPITNKTAEQTVAALEAMLSPTPGQERFLYLMDGQREYRCYISSISYGKAWSPDAPGALTLSVIQIPTNAAGLIGED